ncbi:MAG: hypothetical protein II670_01565 [Alphaproteobacteria bacterium]|nr:hypothetical protein [Alphaproteobacteria bacterium]
MTPKTKLHNPYYYVKDNVVFKISYNLDNAEDACAKHYVTFETESKTMKKGQYYTDLHGDRKKVTADGTVNVSTGNLNLTECEKAFPYIAFTYKVEGNDDDTFTDVLWFDNAIKVGDKISTGRFEKTIHGETESTKDFAKVYKDEVLASIAESVTKGLSIEDAKKAHPEYLFISNTFNYNKKKVTRTSISSSGDTTALKVFPIKEEDITTAVITLINTKATNYANGMLDNVDKKVKDTDNYTLINSSNITDI